jgi:hypothetical protein
MSFEQPLDNIIRLKFIVGNSKNFEGLLPSNKATLNSEALFGNLFATFIAKLFHAALVSFLMKIFKNFFTALLRSQWANEVLTNLFVLCKRGLHFLISCLHSWMFFFDRSLISTGLASIRILARKRLLESQSLFRRIWMEPSYQIWRRKLINFD